MKLILSLETKEIPRWCSRTTKVKILLNDAVLEEPSAAVGRHITMFSHFHRMLQSLSVVSDANSLFLQTDCEHISSLQSRTLS